MERMNILPGHFPVWPHGVDMSSHSLQDKTSHKRHKGVFWGQKNWAVWSPREFFRSQIIYMQPGVFKQLPKINKPSFKSPMS